MCVNYSHTKTKGTRLFARRLGVEPDLFRFGADFGPGSTISIVTGSEAGNRVRDAIWWLYLQQTDSGLKPQKDYFSVNTRYDKLARKPEYRTHRCIVPATAIVESQDGKRPHLLEPAGGSVMALGGLWKEWTDKTTGEAVYSASVITLPGHPALASVHRKSIPLWLPEEAFDRWLDPYIQDPAGLQDLLEPTLRADLVATPIKKARNKTPIGEPFRITAE